MIINTLKLKETESVIVKGDESWLECIYSEFKHGYDKPVQADLEIKEKYQGSYSVNGQVSFSPLLVCGRSHDPKPWPMTIKVDVLYRPESSSPKFAPNQEVVLTKADLDQYYVENNQINLLGLISELIFLEAPTSCVANEANICQFCGEELSSGKVYSSGDHEPSGPFASLKDLLN